MSEPARVGSKQTWVPTEFEIGMPIALGKIGLIPDEATMTRCVTVQMLRETEAERDAQMASDGSECLTP